MSLIHRPVGLDYPTWIERWHATQSPLSGELQPRCRYVRNEVVRPLTAGAPEIHGVVEEAWPSAQHVADPMLFFNARGDPAVLSEHITAMLESVNVVPRPLPHPQRDDERVPVQVTVIGQKCPHAKVDTALGFVTMGW